MAPSVSTDAKVAIQMRLSNPLLLASLGVLFVSVSCTLITDVNRSKIPDGSSDGGVPSTGGSVTNPPGNGGGGDGGVPSSPLGGSGGDGGTPVTPSAGAPNGDAGAGGTESNGGTGGTSDTGGLGGGGSSNDAGGAVNTAGAPI